MKKATKKHELELLEMGKSKTGYEVNFVVKKFNGLSQKKKKSLFKKIHSDITDANIKAGCELLRFITNNPEEMAKFVSSASDIWLVTPNDAPYKARYLWLYFKHHLTKNSEGEFSIEPIS